MNEIILHQNEFYFLHLPLFVNHLSVKQALLSSKKKQTISLERKTNNNNHYLSNLPYVNKSILTENLFTA